MTRRSLTIRCSTELQRSFIPFGHPITTFGIWEMQLSRGDMYFYHCSCCWAGKPVTEDSQSHRKDFAYPCSRYVCCCCGTYAALAWVIVNIWCYVVQRQALRKFYELDHVLCGWRKKLEALIMGIPGNNQLHFFSHWLWWRPLHYEERISLDTCKNFRYPGSHHPQMQIRELMLSIGAPILNFQKRAVLSQ